MDLQRLQYFLAVLEHTSINAAASSLGVAQPTISQAIRAMERDLGVPLFHRIGRGMVATSAAHALVGPARQILRDISAAESSVRDGEGQVRGTLEIAAIPSLAGGVLTQCIADFRRLYPKVSITLGFLQEEAAAAATLREGHSEIVVTHFPLDTGPEQRPRDEPLSLLGLGSQEYWIALPPQYADQVPKRDPMAWTDMPEIPLVTVPEGSGHAAEIRAALARAGRLQPPSAVVEHREARLAFVLAGVGGTFLERSTAEAARKRGAVIRAFDPPLSRPFGLVYSPQSISTLGRAFLEVAQLRTTAG